MAMLALGLEGITRTTQSVTKSTKELGKSMEASKQGQKKFTYDDGFSCTALNQKSADKKHLRWLNSHPLTQ